MHVEVITDPKAARLCIRALGERSKVLADAEMHVFHGAVLYIMSARKGGRPLAMDVAYFGKAQRSIWEPYENWYIGYVPTAERGRGNGTKLRSYVDSLAVKAGCRRVHSLAGTQLGLLLHSKMGYLIWGLTEQLEVCCDSPLVQASWPTKEVPKWAAKKLSTAPVLPTKPLTVAAIQRRLAGRSLAYESTELLAQVRSRA
jgi:hypothetical protein